MCRGEVLNMLPPAFGALDHGRGSRGLHRYKAWVRTLATKEYVDELVVLATVREINLEINCVPFTTDSAARPWTISKYTPLASSGVHHPPVTLGTTTFTSCGLHQQRPRPCQALNTTNEMFTAVGHSVRWWGH